MCLRKAAIDGFVRVQESPVGANVEFDREHEGGIRRDTAPAECEPLLIRTRGRYSPCQISREDIPYCDIKDLRDLTSI
jgi:hypothetical protein